MRLTRNVVGLVGVAVMAFTAGHLDLFPTTLAGDESTTGGMDMQAYIEAGTPGEFHKKLDVLVGDWEGEFTIWMDPSEPPMLSKGTVKREWVFGGRYLKETIEATSDMGTFNGMGFFGYNNVDGQYEMVWMDSMSTKIYSETGVYNPDKQTLFTRGSHRDPVTGRVLNGWGKLDLSDPDRQVYAGYLYGPDGREFKHFEGVSKRMR